MNREALIHDEIRELLTQDPNTVSVATHDEPDMAAKPPTKLYHCSVCGGSFVNGKDCSGSISSPERLIGFRNVNTNEGHYTYLYDGLPCAERLSLAISTLHAGIDQHGYQQGQLIRA